MNYKLFFFSLFFVFSLSASAQEKKQNFFDTCNSIINKIQSGSISYSITTKHFLSDIFRSTKNKLLFSYDGNKTDSVCFILKEGNGDIIFYDYKNYCVYLSNQKKIILSHPSWQQIRSWIRMELCPLVTRTENVFQNIRDTENLINRYTSDTSIDGKSYFVVTLIKKAELNVDGIIMDSSSLRTSIYIFDQQTYLPMSFQELVTWKNDSQYTEIHFDQISYINLMSSNDLASYIHSLVDSLHSIRDVIDEEKSDVPVKVKELLKKDTYAYNIRFITPESDTIHLTNIESKLTLLQFTYISCFPCQVQISVLNRINNKYKDKGLKVIALDPIDDSRSERMRVHITKNQIGYQIASVSRVIAEQKFNVEAYPTIYLLDKDKKIIFSNWGNRGNLEKQLEEVIEKNLQ